MIVNKCTFFLSIGSTPLCPSLSTVRIGKPNILPADSCKLYSMSKSFQDPSRLHIFKRCKNASAKLPKKLLINSDLKRPRNAKSSLVGVSSLQTAMLLSLRLMNPTRRLVPLSWPMASFEKTHKISFPKVYTNKHFQKNHLRVSFLVYSSIACSVHHKMIGLFFFGAGFLVARCQALRPGPEWVSFRWRLGASARPSTAIGQKSLWSMRFWHISTEVHLKVAVIT